jgi:histidinol-phosphate aminotransferase
MTTPAAQQVTPVTFASSTEPAAYSWEATDEEVSARYGVAVEEIIRFDLNTSPTPPAIADRILAGGRFVTPLSEYPPSDYRLLIEAAANRYGVDTDELLVGAGADEILDLVGKTFLAPGDVAIVPTPTYAMFRVITEQRGAIAAAVPRLASESWRLDRAAVRDAARNARVLWLCSPNNPTALSEPPDSIGDLLERLTADAVRDRREAPVVVLDEAYAEFAGASLANLRLRYSNLVVVRTASKAYALAGLRVGFAIARPETIARIAPYRPPGSVSTVSVTVVTEALRDDTIAADNVGRVSSERERLTAALAEAGWQVGPSVTNFLLVDFGTAQRSGLVAEGLLRRGLVPRTFGAGHPLAAYLRLTVRDAAANDRLIEAARASTAELA